MNNYFELYWYRLNSYIEFRLHSLLRFRPMLNAFLVLHIELKPFFLSACEFWESLNTMSAYLSRLEFPCTRTHTHTIAYLLHSNGIIKIRNCALQFYCVVGRTDNDQSCIDKQVHQSAQVFDIRYQTR